MKNYLHMYEVDGEGCWLFTGTVGTQGYGTCRGTGAHRYFYEHLIGDIPDGMHIDHACHVPGECAGGRSCKHRRCVNPQHLAVTTPRENVLRSNSFVAVFAAATSCPYGHEYSGPNLIVLPKQRTCRECTRRRWTAAHEAMKGKATTSHAATGVEADILAALRDGPATDFAIADRLSRSRQFVSERRAALVRGGAVVEVGKEHRSVGRRPARAWAVS